MAENIWGYVQLGGSKKDNVQARANVVLECTSHAQLSEQTRHSVLKAAILINVLARSTDCYNYLVFTNSLYVVGKVACHTFQKANRVRYIIYVFCLIPRDSRCPSKPAPSHDGGMSPKHYRTGVNIVKFDLHNLHCAVCYQMLQ